ncbi:MAG: hypothetical protein LBL43_06050 [Treponema sp.]|jgi:hypothetical protein|nr:hypothetical protein [Treponema sp.]
MVPINYSNDTMIYKSLNRTRFRAAAAALCMFLTACAGEPAKTPSPVPVPRKDVDPGKAPPGPQVEEAGGQDLPPPPGGLVFISERAPSLEPALGVGTAAPDRGAFRLSAAERDQLAGIFRSAYTDGLIRGRELRGVLGGDQVHPWTEREQPGWVQNWRAEPAASNSWGLPSLVLAILGPEQEAGRRAFMVRGPILDFYGRAAGIGGANGEKGYGFPRGEDFYWDGGLAQRFDLGLIRIDRDGQGSFLPEAAPSTLVPVPPDLGRFSGEGSLSAAYLRDAFLGAWKIVLDQNLIPLRDTETAEEDSPPSLVPDGPGIYLKLPEWSFPLSGGGAVEVRELYLQSFNNNTAALLLPLAKELPPHPRFLRHPFLEALLAAGRGAPLPGAGEIEQNPLPGEILSRRNDDFTRKVLEGLSVYGIPLSDPMAREKSAAEGPLLTEAQRFSAGWMGVE